MIEPRAHFQFLRHDSIDPREESPSPALQAFLAAQEASLAASLSTCIHPDLEYEVALSEADADDTQPPQAVGEEDAAMMGLLHNDKHDPTKNGKLLLSFLCLIVCGAGNAVLAKLQTIPMYNYPVFLHLYTNFMYIPICFAYILPVARYGSSITPQHQASPQRPFVIMGFLDCLAATMQTFCAVYVPGPLLVFLPQACIPVSMILSRSLLGERYTWVQYVGALIVLLGVVVVMVPVVTLRQRHAPDYFCAAVDPVQDCTVCQAEVDAQGCSSPTIGSTRPWSVNNNSARGSGMLLNGSSNTSEWLDDDVASQALCHWLSWEEAPRDQEFLVALWSLVLLFSTVPMTLSALYKKRALDDDSADVPMDPIFLNGWVSVYRFLFSFAAVLPAAYLASPSVLPRDVVRNVWDGFQCFAHRHATVTTGCHPDDQCESSQAALYVHLGLLCYVLYSVCILFVLKYGSSSLLFLALTVIVPVGQLAFSLPFLPQPLAATPLHLSDALSLLIMVVGLVLYRFSERPRSLQRTNVRDDASSSAAGAAFNDNVPRAGRVPLSHSMSCVEDRGGGLLSDDDDPSRALRRPLLLTGDV